ncbi:MAG: IS630 family transposase [Alphaproteobacteria bacterium]|nr:IS630 family transposase [Alphaproteobacteria bacterium]
MKRMVFLRELRRLIPLYDSENIVYFDESGFKKHSYRAHGWAVRGKKIYGDVSGNNYKCTNLLMAQRAKKWLAPMLFECSCDSSVVNAWLKERLLPLLKKPSIVIMDNAAFHKKKEIAALLKKHGHVLLPLPPYSPDFNPIEKSFGVLKRKREFAPPNTSIAQLIISSDSYLE